MLSRKKRSERKLTVIVLLYLDGEPSDGYAYHQSTAATGSEYQPVESSTTNLSSVR